MDDILWSVIVYSLTLGTFYFGAIILSHIVK